MADPDSAALIAEYDSGIVGNCVQWAAFALIVYEYLITFAVEVELFWRKDVNGASILFFLNRYVVLFYNLSILWFWWPFTESTYVFC
ncbi:hypothetical protein LXA43DRAFT_1099613 [Ganoderma leucocontextum]|nr:hypothetical protein LXA43DRAFT_1099613 [Ganoderma leucocontextum]